MEINEIEETGKKFRQLMDGATKLWQKISFWIKSSDVEFNDGKNAETKVGSIDGITDSLVSTSSNIAASAKTVSTINNNLGGFTPIIDETGKITGYKTSVGDADTVFPFNNILPCKITLSMDNLGSGSNKSRTWLKIENNNGIIFEEHFSANYTGVRKVYNYPSE